MLKSIDKVLPPYLVRKIDNLLGRKPKYLFIFGHMRSRSSVLSHILGNNPQICGYCELHLDYIDQTSLDEMHKQLESELDCNLNRSYLLDKILGGQHEFSEKVINITKPKVIFLIREPESTLKSIINMGYVTGVKTDQNPELALNYYCSRLAQLEALSKRFEDYLFLESDELIENSDACLNQLTQWLALTNPLKKDYTLFKNTGKPSYGDPTEKIKSGILKRTEGYPDIIIPSDLLRKGNEAYQQCKKTLKSGHQQN